MIASSLPVRTAGDHPSSCAQEVDHRLRVAGSSQKKQLSLLRPYVILPRRVARICRRAKQPKENNKDEQSSNFPRMESAVPWQRGSGDGFDGKTEQVA